MIARSKKALDTKVYRGVSSCYMGNSDETKPLAVHALVSADLKSSIETIAQQDRRTQAETVRILLEEAIDARNKKKGRQ